MMFSDPIENKNPLPELMTIFYRKKTGEIKEIISDACDMSVFGAEQEDYELIWDYIIVEYDDYLRFNINQFIVDIENKELCMKSNNVTNNYRVLYN